jgi:predicted CopG family antitoxin
MGMTTKNISITEEAYSRLASLREKSESFSEIINRLTRKKQLLEFAGMLSQNTVERIEQHIAKRRAILDKETKRRRAKLLQRLS